MASMATTSIFRSGGKEGVEHDSYASRYLIYPHLLAATIFCLLAVSMIYKKLKWPLVGVCAILFIKAYKENYNYGETGFSNENTRLTTKRYNYPDTLAAKKIEADACKQGIYCIKDNR